MKTLPSMNASGRGQNSQVLHRKILRARWLVVIAALVSYSGDWGLAQTSNLVGPPSLGGGMAQTAQYNSEWVESSSPIPGGGVVATTHFPSTGNTLTTVRESADPMAAARVQPVGGVVPTAATLAPAQTTPNYAAIPTGNGGYLVPTVQYVPMTAGAGVAPNQVAAYNPAMCANCQTPMMTQPTAYQQGFVPQSYANQTPMLPPTAGGVYGPIPGAMPQGMYQQPMGVAPTAAANNPGGWRPLIPRSLPAGTYIGQGWLGQPKAYVSSQPFRNILRYMIAP